MTFTPAANSIRWLSFRNDSGEQIPPFAILRPTGVVTLEGQAVLTIAKPNSVGGSFYFFNGPFFVDVGGFGSCTADFPCFAAYDTLDTPSVGQEWGAQNNQWTLRRGNTGYKIVGGAIDGRVEVVATGTPTALARFFLETALAQGGSASAQNMTWNGTAWVADGGPAITVYDTNKLGPAPYFHSGWYLPSAASGHNEIILLDGSGHLLGKAGDNILTGSSGTVHVYFGTPGSESDIGVTVTAYNHFDMVTGGDWVWLNWNADGWYLMPNGQPGKLKWAIATSNWSNASGNNSTVACNEASDKDGTLVLDGGGMPIPLTVYLPRAGAGDPNVRSGDVIGYEVDDNGLAICVTNYMDDKIGTVKMWVGGDSDPILSRGWRIYSPSPGRFPVGVTSSDSDIPATVPGATGGTKKHTHPDDGVGRITSDDTALVIYPHYGFETSFTEIAVSQEPATYPAALYVTASGGTANVTISSGNTGDPTTSPTISSTGNLTGTTDNATTGLGRHPDHRHDCTVGSYVMSQWNGSEPSVNFYAFDPSTFPFPTGPEVPLAGHSDDSTTHGNLDPGHVHSLSSIGVLVSGTLPAHVHSIGGLSGSGPVTGLNVEVDPNPHWHGLPPIVVDPGSHNHAIPEMDHTLIPNPHHHTLTVPQSKHIPPFFGIYFIERFE